MLEITIDESVHNGHQDFVDLDEGDLKMGLIFETEEIVMKSIQLWSEKTFCPLSKVCC
jgi:hypothetical protein